MSDTRVSSPVHVPGHRFTFSSATGAPLVPRRQTSGGVRVSCLCGWESPLLQANRDDGQRHYRHEHLAPLRAARRTTCRVCCEVKLPIEMASAKGAGSICKRCLTAKTRAWAAQNPSEWNRHRWAHHLRKKFGITVEQYDAMLVAQGGRCAICRVLSTDSPRRFHVDHDHATSRVRGLLCYPCNTGLGVFRDDAGRLKAAIAYLKRSVCER